MHVTFKNKDGTKRTVKGKVGDNLMYLAHRHGIEMEGACEASLACSTCHVYVNDKFLNKLPDPVDEEDDMLDLASFLKPNSRLGEFHFAAMNVLLPPRSTKSMCLLLRLSNYPH